MEGKVPTLLCDDFIFPHQRRGEFSGMLYVICIFELFGIRVEKLRSFRFV